MDTPLLWHIPLSHFSEKVRWALDYKAITHRRRVLGADYLIRAWRATGRGTLPVLFLDGRPMGDSTQIIEALEERHPEPALYPRDVEARQRALALEDYFDEQLGASRPALRSFTYQGREVRHDPNVLSASTPRAGRAGSCPRRERLRKRGQSRYLCRHSRHPG